MKPRHKAILAAGLLLGSGLLAGFGLGAWLGTRTMLRMIQSDPNETALADLAVSHLHADLSEELQLDEPTKAALLKELHRSAGEVKRARAEGVKIMMATFGQAGGRVAALLPPEKRERFYQLARQRFDRAGLGGFLPPAPPPSDSAKPPAR